MIHVATSGTSNSTQNNMELPPMRSFISEKQNGKFTALVDKHFQPNLSRLESFVYIAKFDR